MLLKLLKYDFRAMWKQFSLIWGAAFALSLVNRAILFLRFGDDLPINPDLFSLGLISVIMAMFVISIRFVINRFSEGLLGSEGYLMHTLPVRSWQLVLSKLVCGAVTWIISGMVALVSPILMTPIHYWREIIQITFGHYSNLFIILEICLFFASVIIQIVATIYLAVSIGHLCVHHRRLVSVAAFIGLYILLVNVWMFLEDLIWRWMNSDVSIQSNLLAATATMLIPAAVFLTAVCWILDHKLNLE